MNLEEKLRAGRFVLTAEVTPPVSADRNDLLATAMPLKGLPDRRERPGGPGPPPTSRCRHGRGHAGAGGRRADPPTYLLRPQPHRAAERPARRGRRPHTASS